MNYKTIQNMKIMLHVSGRNPRSIVIAGWDVGQVTKMNSMFEGAKSFRSDFSK